MAKSILQIVQAAASRAQRVQIRRELSAKGAPNRELQRRDDIVEKHKEEPGASLQEEEQEQDRMNFDRWVTVRIHPW